MTENTNPHYLWKDAEGNKLDMMTMSVQHLQYAHTHACGQEFKYHKLSGLFSDKRDQLEEIAELRGIELAYPDEKHPSPKWGSYFCNIRKTKSVSPTFVVKKPNFTGYKGLKEVNVLD